VRRILVIGACALAGVLLSVVPASAAKNPTHGQTNWGQKDTAVYVVSTLNLLRERHGRPISDILSKRYAIAHYDVYSDSQQSDSFFIELKLADGSMFGAFAYHMGWTKPMSVSTSLDPLHVRHAVAEIQKEFAADAKQLIGSFTSTLPT
jgi:hypothetical protein